MLEAYILEIDRNLSTSEYEKLMVLVSDEKRERIGKFHFFEDAQRSLLGDIMIRKLITQKLGFSNDRITFSTNEYGKPYLWDPPSDLHFNVSHAGRYVACAIDDAPLGIDVEILKPIDMKIAERFFCPEETEYILSVPETDQMRAFYEVWTKKEAYVKCMGMGLSIPLNSFCVLGCNPDLYFQKLLSNDTAICHTCVSQAEIPAWKQLRLSIDFIMDF